MSWRDSGYLISLVHVHHDAWITRKRFAHDHPMRLTVFGFDVLCVYTSVDMSKYDQTICEGTKFDAKHCLDTIIVCTELLHVCIHTLNKT